VALANAGANVTAIDTNEATINLVNAGQMPFMESNGDAHLEKALTSGRLRATSDASGLRVCDTVILVIGTPVDEHANPDPDAVVRVLSSLEPNLSSGQLLILRSTVFPGVTRRIEQWVADRHLNLEVSFCPERIAEGHAFEELTSLPQLIGTRSDTAWSKSKELFELLTPRTIRLSPEEAELAKLFTNSWRYLKFAAANQFFMMASDLGVDFDKVHAAMTERYPRAADVPKAGLAAGPCLLKDTMQLDSLTGGSFFLGQAAMKINESIPDYLVRMARASYPLAEMNVGILGMSFKADIDDPRDSLSYKLRKLLRFEAKKVLASDPYVSDSRLIEQDLLLKESDLIFIGAPHTLYRALNFNQPVIDIWGITDSRRGQ
jgi:UDP-N-acetyl-D-mannosaminuronic acid dehydrogenase